MTTAITSHYSDYEADRRERHGNMLSKAFNPLNEKLTALLTTNTPNLSDIVDQDGYVTIDLVDNGKDANFIDRHMPEALKRFILKKWPENVHGLTPELIKEHSAFKDVKSLLERTGHSIAAVEVQKSHQDIGFKKAARSATALVGTTALATAPFGDATLTGFFGLCTAIWGYAGSNKFEATKPHQIKLRLAQPQQPA